MVDPPSGSDIIKQLKNTEPPNFSDITTALKQKCTIRNLFTPGTAVPGLGNYQCPLRTAIKELER